MRRKNKKYNVNVEEKESDFIVTSEESDYSYTLDIVPRTYIMTTTINQKAYKSSHII